MKKSAFFNFLIIFPTIFFVISCSSGNQNLKENISIFSKKGFYIVPHFGPNPGNLKMYVYIPKRIKPNATVIIALHGCWMNAIGIKDAGNWPALAEKYGFIMIFPEQKTENHPNKCFNWSLNSQFQKKKGEAASIIQMLSFTSKYFKISSENTFLTGISAGAVMGINLLSLYPQYFAAGSLIEGIPFKTYAFSHFYPKASSSPLYLFYASLHATNRTAKHWNHFWGKVLGEKGKSPENNLNNKDFEKNDQQWGDLVRMENPSFKENYPKLMVIHGSIDPIVNPINFKDTLKQWRNLFQLNKDAEKTAVKKNLHIIKYFKNNELVIKGVFLRGFVHGQPLNLKMDKNAIIKNTPPYFSYQVENFHYPLEALKFFQIIQ